MLFFGATYTKNLNSYLKESLKNSIKHTEQASFICFMMMKRNMNVKSKWCLRTWSTLEVNKYFIERSCDLKKKNLQVKLWVAEIQECFILKEEMSLLLKSNT